MYVTSVNNIVYPVASFGSKKHDVQPYSDKNELKERKTVDALRKQLMSLAVASMALVGTSGMTSCVTDEPELPDTFIPQCPKVDKPIESVDGLVPKADIMFHSIGLLQDGVSITDVDEIRAIDEQTGDKMIFKTNDESSDDKIIMDYTIVKADGSTAESTYKMYDNGYGYITCVLEKADGIDSQYKRYTQFSYDFDDLAEFSSDGYGFTQSGIIRNAGKGRIKRICPDNSVEYYKVSTTLK